MGGGVGEEEGRSNINNPLQAGSDNLFRPLDDRWKGWQFCYSATTSYKRVRVDLDKQLSEQGSKLGNPTRTLHTEALGHMESGTSPGRL